MPDQGLLTTSPTTCNRVFPKIMHSHKCVSMHAKSNVQAERIQGAHTHPCFYRQERDQGNAGLLCDKHRASKHT